MEKQNTDFGRGNLELGEDEVQCQDPTRDARTAARELSLGKFTWAILLTIPFTSSLLLLSLFSSPLEP
jgi:hypothetical protein